MSCVWNATLSSALPFDDTPLPSSPVTTQYISPMMLPSPLVPPTETGSVSSGGDSDDDSNGDGASDDASTPSRDDTRDWHWTAGFERLSATSSRSSSLIERRIPPYSRPSLTVATDLGYHFDDLPSSASPLVLLSPGRQAASPTAVSRVSPSSSQFSGPRSALPSGSPPAVHWTAPVSHVYFVGRQYPRSPYPRPSPLPDGEHSDGESSAFISDPESSYHSAPDFDYDADSDSDSHHGGASAYAYHPSPHMMEYYRARHRANVEAQEIAARRRFEARRGHRCQVVRRLLGCFLWCGLAVYSVYGVQVCWDANMP